MRAAARLLRGRTGKICTGLAVGGFTCTAAYNSPASMDEGSLPDRVKYLEEMVDVLRFCEIRSMHSDAFIHPDSTMTVQESAREHGRDGQQRL